jgi:hypothetical protein
LSRTSFAAHRAKIFRRAPRADHDNAPVAATRARMTPLIDETIGVRLSR